MNSRSLQNPIRSKSTAARSRRPKRRKHFSPSSGRRLKRLLPAEAAAVPAAAPYPPMASRALEGSESPTTAPVSTAQAAGEAVTQPAAPSPQQDGPLRWIPVSFLLVHRSSLMDMSIRLKIPAAPSREM